MTPGDLGNIHNSRNYPNIFTCWWKSLLVATSKFNLPTVRQHTATRKHLFLCIVWAINILKCNIFSINTLICSLSYSKTFVLAKKSRRKSKIIELTSATVWNMSPIKISVVNVGYNDKRGSKSTFALKLVSRSF